MSFHHAFLSLLFQWKLVVSLLCPSFITHVRLSVYSLSSSCSILFSISEVLFWRRRSFVFVWHFDNCEAQSAWTLTLQILHLSPWRVCPAWKVSVFQHYIFSARTESSEKSIVPRSCQMVFNIWIVLRSEVNKCFGILFVSY